MMNMKNNKIFTLISLIVFLQFFQINLHAADLDKIDEEELPAHDPFAGGATIASTSEGESNQASSFGNDNNGSPTHIGIGVLVGDHRNMALISTPDGLTNVYGENEIIFGDIQLLDIFHDWISVRLNAEENYDISIDGKITPQEGN